MQRSTQRREDVLVDMQKRLGAMVLGKPVLSPALRTTVQLRSRHRNARPRTGWGSHAMSFEDSEVGSGRQLKAWRCSVELLRSSSRKWGPTALLPRIHVFLLPGCFATCNPDINLGNSVAHRPFLQCGLREVYTPHRTFIRPSLAMTYGSAVGS